MPLLPRASHPRKYSLGTCSQPASPANLCSPNLGPQGRRVVSATATHTTHDGAHLRSGPRWLGAESCFGSKGPVPSQPLVALWRLCWLLITAWVQSRSKLKTTLARLLTTGIISGAGLAVCHMLFFFQRNGRDKARQFQVVRTPGCGVQSPSPGFRPEDSHPAHAPGLRPEATPPPQFLLTGNGDLGNWLLHIRGTKRLHEGGSSASTHHGGAIRNQPPPLDVLLNCLACEA